MRRGVNRMRKFIMTFAIATALVLSGLSFASSTSAAPLPSNCDKDRGVITCEESNPVGNSGNTKTSTTTQKGSFSSSHDPSCTFTNPGGHTRDVAC